MLRIASFASRLLAAILLILTAESPASAGVRDLLPGRHEKRLSELNCSIAGQVLDLTQNHGCDRRLYSPALCQKRDVYIYLPPGYDGTTLFPSMLWLHPLGFDEESFLEVVPVVDRGIRCGLFPPIVIVAPDGSISGKPSVRNAGSFYCNSAAGRFEDYIMDDVWGFAKRNFAVRPERDSRVVAGVSMGGFGAYMLAFHHRDEFGHVAGVMPPLDLRYSDCRGKYLADFNPTCRGERVVFPRNEIIGQFYGVLLVRSKRLLDPLVGRKLDANATVRAMNPKDLLFSQQIQPGEFDLFVGYGTKDEFNIDAEVRSFLEGTTARGIPIEVWTVDGGRHNKETVLALFTPFSKWMMRAVGAYAPNATPLAAANRTPLCAVRPPPCLIPPASAEMESTLRLVGATLP